MDIKDGGPAFPVTRNTIRDMVGMSIRDWFAGQALVALAGEWQISMTDKAAQKAYQVADAMLKVRANDSSLTS